MDTDPERTLPIRYSKNIPYHKILLDLREKFDKKWNERNISPFGVIEKDLDYICVVGEGSFGSVKLYKNKNSDEMSAVKCLNKKKIVEKKEVDHVLTEKRVLQSVNFQFLIYLKFSQKDNNFLYLGMPYISGGYLLKLLKSYRKFGEDHAKFYAAQVVLGLEYMHAMDLLYRDLKPENILLDVNGYIKITDFGFTKRVPSRTLTICGTPEYLAPEIIQSKSYGSGVDWWAFGVLIFELTTGNTPFAKYADDIMEMYAKICDAKYIMPTNLSTSLQNLLSNLIEIDLSKRYGNLKNGTNDIKNHEWFKTIKWLSILNQDISAPYIPRLRPSKYPFDIQTLHSEIFTKSKVDKFNDLFSEF